MPQEVELALSLQRKDRLLRQLEIDIRSLPKRIAELEAKLQDSTRRVEADRAALAANEKEIKRLENANEEQRLKMDRLKKQQMQATTPAQLNAFQHEIAWAENEIAKNAALLAPLQEENTQLAARILEGDENLAKEKLATEEATKAAVAKSEEDRKKGVRIYREREAEAKAMPPSLLATYERIRKKHKDNVVVAEIDNEMCSACQMKVRPALMQQIRQSPEKLFHCESCGRIMLYNPPRSIEGIPVNS